MNITGISIAVKDLDKSIEYYTQVLGFHFFDKFYTGIGPNAILTSRKLQVSLFETDKVPEGVFDIFLRSNNIDDDIADLRAKGAKIVMEPREASLCTLAQVADPNGIRLTVLQWRDGFAETEDSIPDFFEYMDKIK